MSNPAFARVSGKILSASVLQYRPTNGKPAAFTWRYSDVHAYTYTASAYLDKPNHPLYDFVKRRWGARQEPFWLSVITKKHGHRSRCVRSWLARRLRLAVIASLEKNGYSKDGVLLDGIEKKKELFGTAQFVAESPMIKMSQERVQAQTDQAVEQMLRSIRSRESGTYCGRRIKTREAGGRASSPKS